MTDNDDARHTPTITAPPPSEPTRETLPPGPDNEEAERVMRTILPAGLPSGALVDVSDSVIGRLIAEIAEAARVMLDERDARVAQAATSAQNQTTLIDQQNEIIRILQRTEQTTEANHQLQLEAIKRLEKSDDDQDSKIAHHAAQIAELHTKLDALKTEMLIALPDAVRAAVEPYAASIEALEQRIRELEPRESQAPAPPG